MCVSGQFHLKNIPYLPQDFTTFLQKLCWGWKLFKKNNKRRIKYKFFVLFGSIENGIKGSQKHQAWKENPSAANSLLVDNLNISQRLHLRYISFIAWTILDVMDHYIVASALL